MKLLCFCCIVFLTAGLALANVKMSQPAPLKPSIAAGTVVLHSTLEVVPDARANDARLQIAQSTLNELRASGGGGVGPAAFTTVGFGSTRTIIAGCLMFVAFSVAGVLLARKVRPSALSQTHKLILALVLLGGLIGTATIITRGNVGPPGSFRWRNLPQALTKGQATAGGLDVEIVPDNEMSGIKFRLIVPIKDPSAPGEE